MPRNANEPRRQGGITTSAYALHGNIPPRRAYVKTILPNYITPDKTATVLGKNQWALRPMPEKSACAFPGR
jgi:hypothetical protein